MPIIQKELDSIHIRWNTYKIRATRHQECPAGKPDVLYYLSDLQQAEDYKVGFELDLIETVQQLTRKKRPFCVCRGVSAVNGTKWLANAVYKS